MNTLRKTRSVNMRLVMTSLLAVLLLSVLPYQSEAKPQKKQSGIVGQVLIGPTCPVVHPGDDCADLPYQTSITVLSRKGKVLGQVETDAEGHFELLISPGVYILVPALPEVEAPNPGDPPLGDVYPYAAPLTVTVKAKRLTPVIINYDSGVR